MEPVVYILKEKAGKYYVGSTVDMEKRNQRHIRHTASMTTKMGEWHLYAYRICLSLSEARALEQKIKSYKSGNAFKKIINGEENEWIIVPKKVSP